MENNWKYKSLQALQKKEWSQSDHDSYLVRQCFELSKIPLIDFTVEDLRLMIGQNIGLEYLIPLAIEKLQENILAEGDYYPGDLIKNVFGIDTGFWIINKSLYLQLNQIIEDGKTELAEEDINLEKFYSIIF